MANKQVYIGGAHMDENGKATGGKAGNQTGRELGEGLYYKHKNGWYVFRANDPTVRRKLAEAMSAACANKHIGYDQAQRNSLYKIVGQVGFNPARIVMDCETDCSALVRVCCAYAGVMLPDFNTAYEPYILMESGAFSQVPLDRNSLQVGDILCTPVKGHTEIVTRIVDGTKTVFEGDQMNVLKRGSRGHEVVVLQGLLNLFNGAGLYPDGDFGPKTEEAVYNYQKAEKLEADGIVGKNTWSKLLKG